MWLGLFSVNTKVPTVSSPQGCRLQLLGGGGWGGFGLFRAGHRFIGLCVIFNIKPGDRFAPESSL